ncbi:hypothetical protein ABT275_39470 [Streptomyces sp. NPDC001185]|uniref:hypothetical protein n=1 Tax=Streptomyces sp. NPDC001185 TaxID=3154380 RepID=UPI003326E370
MATGLEGRRRQGAAFGWTGFDAELSDSLFAALEAMLAKGAVVHGWPDQTWTLAWIKTLIGWRFHKSLTLCGVSLML